MENKNIHRYYQAIWEKFLSLRSEGLTYKEQTSLLIEFNNEIYNFSDLLHQFINKLIAQVQDRMALQGAMSKATLNESAFASFYNDQIAFYRSWLNNFEQMTESAESKCVVHLTVKQLLLLLRLAKDMNLIPDTQLKPYLHFLQNNVRTQKQETLSYESLRKKYSEIDAPTIRQLRQLLERMLRRLNHYQATLNGS